MKQLASRVVDLQVENNALKADNAKLKADFQVLKKVSKQSKKEICMKDQGIQSDKENVVIIEQPSEVPTEVFDIPSHPNQFEVLDDSSEIPPPTDTPSDQGTRSPPLFRNTGSRSETRLESRRRANDQPIVRDQERKGIVFLADSNAKYIDTHKLSRDKEVQHEFCPTIRSTITALNTHNFGSPTDIIIHTGTNDLESTPVHQCMADYEELIIIAAEKYPRSRILISTILKRADHVEDLRIQLNAKLRQLTVPPNVHFIQHENILEDMLYDNKHLRRRCVGAFVRNLKDTLFNRIAHPTNRNHTPQNRSTDMNRQQDLPPRPPANHIPYDRPNMNQQNLPQRPPSHRSYPPPMFPHHPSTHPSFAEITKIPVNRGPAPPSLVDSRSSQAAPSEGQTGSPALPDANIIMKLFKIYDMIRQV